MSDIVLGKVRTLLEAAGEQWAKCVWVDWIGVDTP